MRTESVAYRASGTAGGLTRATPRAAALAFFDSFPTCRKCDVISGTSDGHFFTVRYGRYSEGDWPSSWKSVTKKTAVDLPDAAQPNGPTT